MKSRRVIFGLSFLTALLLLPASMSAQYDAMPITPREMADLRVDKIRAKLDSVRKTRHRPTVALVLSGGGAKGAAHVGVIRYLESVGIPIDVVMGTSMGGLVGGIYSLGYNAVQLDSIIRGINWEMALSDKVPRNFMSYSQIKYKEKYVLSFPFYYEKEDYIGLKKDEMQYPHRSEGIHLGAGNDDATRLVRDNLMGSLPSGMVYGQNVGNLFSSLTVGYQEETDFYDFPIPFLCVATDLVTGTAKIWTKGKITTALRSTMSIPGLFTPVKTSGMVLVDGGMRNNYPTDLARLAGADIVIGVTLSSGYKGYNEINNLGDILDTGIDMMGRSSYEANVELPDVTIRPDLTGYGMMSFESGAIDTIIMRGYSAAKEAARQLDSLKKAIGPDTTRLAARPATDLTSSKVHISGVEIGGVSDPESLFLMGKLRLIAGTDVDKSDIEEAVATIYGTNAFDYVSYELLENGDDSYNLKFNCRKGPIHKVGVSGRLDTEEVVTVLLNLGFGVQKLQGTSVDFTGKIGSNPRASIVLSRSNPKGHAVNFAGDFRYVDKSTFSMGDNRFMLNLSNFRLESYISNIKWSRFFLKTGIRAERFNISDLMSGQFIGDYDDSALKNGYLSIFLDSRNESLDNGYVPFKGHSVGFSYQYVFGGHPNAVKDFHAVSLDAMKVFGNSRFVAIPSVKMRYLIGENVPVMFSNLMGGAMSGRYLDQQMAFYGVENVISMNRMLMVARADLRATLAKNNYLSLILNHAVSVSDLSSFTDRQDDILNVFGTALRYTYNSIIGPLSADIHWSSMTKKVGVHLSLGFDF